MQPAKDHLYCSFLLVFGLRYALHKLKGQKIDWAFYLLKHAKE